MHPQRINFAWKLNWYRQSELEETLAAGQSWSGRPTIPSWWGRHDPALR